MHTSLRALLALVLFTLGTFGAVSAQSEAALVFYLAREDSDQDGLISVQDPVGVYMTLPNQTSTRLSLADESVLNYRAAPGFDGAAYAAEDAEGFALWVRDLAGEGVRFPLTNLRFALVERYDTIIWISARDANGQTSIIGFDPVSGEIARRELAAPDVQVKFDPAGGWVSAYSRGSQTMELYALPSLEPAALTLPPAFFSRPVWSPNGGLLALAAGNDPGGADVQLLLIDAATGETRSASLPPAVNPDGFVEWSATGTYITASLLPDESTGEALPVSLIAVDSLTVTPLLDEVANLRVVAWAFDDRTALVSRTLTIDATIATDYALLNPADASLTSLEIVSFAQPTYFNWSPTAPTLGILGTAAMDGQSGIFTMDAETQALGTLYTSTDPGLASGALIWTTDGSQMLILSGVQDPIELLLGVTYTLSIFDPATGALTRLSPNTISPLPYGFQVR